MKEERKKTRHRGAHTGANKTAIVRQARYRRPVAPPGSATRYRHPERPPDAAVSSARQSHVTQTHHSPVLYALDTKPGGMRDVKTCCSFDAPRLHRRPAERDHPGPGRLRWLQRQPFRGSQHQGQPGPAGDHRPAHQRDELRLLQLAEDTSLGYERVATLINKARAEFPNTVLLDNGDTIQGTALSDYQALINPVACNQSLAIYKVMNQSKYDGGGIGNHEFNYGLPYLNQVTGSAFQVDGVSNGSTRCAGPNFPQVLANVYSAKTKAPLFNPYQIITKTLTATAPDGSTVQVPVNIGIIGFT